MALLTSHLFDDNFCRITYDSRYERNVDIEIKIPHNISVDSFMGKKLIEITTDITKFLVSTKRDDNMLYNTLMHYCRPAIEIEGFNSDIIVAKDDFIIGKLLNNKEYDVCEYLYEYDIRGVLSNLENETPVSITIKLVTSVEILENREDPKSNMFKDCSLLVLISYENDNELMNYMIKIPLSILLNRHIHHEDIINDYKKFMSEYIENLMIINSNDFNKLTEDFINRELKYKGNTILLFENIEFSSKLDEYTKSSSELLYLYYKFEFISHSITPVTELLKDTINKNIKLINIGDSYIKNKINSLIDSQVMSNLI